MLADQTAYHGRKMIVRTKTRRTKAADARTDALIRKDTERWEKMYEDAQRAFKDSWDIVEAAKEARADYLANLPWWKKFLGIS